MVKQIKAAGGFQRSLISTLVSILILLYGQSRTAQIGLAISHLVHQTSMWPQRIAVAHAFALEDGAAHGQEVEIAERCMPRQMGFGHERDDGKF